MLRDLQIFIIAQNSVLRSKNRQDSNYVSSEIGIYWILEKQKLVCSLNWYEYDRSRRDFYNNDKLKRTSIFDVLTFELTKFVTDC